MVFYSKYQIFLFFKPNLNMAMHSIMMSIGVNMHHGLA
ncbi:hypothetical protein PPRY_a0859 [Pseudoalteromonas prydzensis ACAM 620]|nr:hypothetical protein [Pseudoalteromonas prydzensis ACAM 620]